MTPCPPVPLMLPNWPGFFRLGCLLLLLAALMVAFGRWESYRDHMEAVRALKEHAWIPR